MGIGSGLFIRQVAICFVQNRVSLRVEPAADRLDVQLGVQPTHGFRYDAA